MPDWEPWMMLVVLGIDVAASFLMLNGYWQFGIPAFAQNLRINTTTGKLPTTDTLNAHFTGGFAPGFHFREFDNGSIGFRETFKLHIFMYTPLMRGLIEYNQMTGELKLKGILYWWTFGLIGLLIYRLAGATTYPGNVLMHQITITGFFTILIGGLYLIQFFRFRKVAMEIERLSGEMPSMINQRDNPC